MKFSSQNENLVELLEKHGEGKKRKGGRRKPLVSKAQMKRDKKKLEKLGKLFTGKGSIFHEGAHLRGRVKPPVKHRGGHKTGGPLIDLRKHKHPGTPCGPKKLSKVRPGMKLKLKLQKQGLL